MHAQHACTTCMHNMRGQREGTTCVRNMRAQHARTKFTNARKKLIAHAQSTFTCEHEGAKEEVMEEKIDKVSTLLKEASEILKTQPSGATPRNTPQPTTDSINR